MAAAPPNGWSVSQVMPVFRCNGVLHRRPLEWLRVTRSPRSGTTTSSVPRR